MNTKTCLIGLAALSAGAIAYGFVGADTALDRIAKAAEKAVSGGGASDAAKLNKDIAAFSAKDKQAPAEAAREWLDLFNRYAALEQDQRRAIMLPENNAQGIAVLMLALPGPDAWPELKGLIDARASGGEANPLVEQSLRLLAGTLTNDPAGQAEAVSKIESIVKKQPQQIRQSLDYIVENLDEALAARAGDPADSVALFERRIAKLEEGNSRNSLVAPDLVSLVGKEKARALLKRALLAPGGQLSIPVGDDTRALARAVALESIDELKAAPWTLAESADASALFEALEKKFPSNQENESERQTASQFYLIHLIASGRTKDAVAHAGRLAKKSQSQSISFGYDVIETLRHAGGATQFANFLHDLLESDPDLPYWNQYIDLAVRARQTKEMTALARAAASREGLPEHREREIRTNFATALLAAGEVEEGAALLEKQITGPLPKPDPGDDLSSVRSTRATDAIRYATIGRLTEHPQWIEIGLKSARAVYDEMGSGYERGSTAKSIAEFLVEAGRAEEAEALLIDALEREAATPPDPNNYNSSDNARDLLIALAGIYHQAGRHADVLALLEKSAHWGAADIAEILTNTARGSKPLGYIAAVALAETGRLDDALRLMNALHAQKSGYDPAYELLVQLAGDDAIARLDELFARDQFEERPLIWKARVLFDKGDLDAAEKTIRQAIAIDPSDGEQPRGDRMRAYAVLADILEKKGDAKTASTMRGAVTAIRLSEEADRVYSAGLMSRAVAMYDEALGHFADAYCIQSRLALRLAELGRNEEAEAHFRRAYELMPESFGRVESHCFGCERAFAGQRAQGIAERVFNQIAENTPEKPQVHYLLGYLRASQERPAEALAAYEKAVALDPDYLNAWKNLADLQGRVFVPQEKLDAAATAILRLDPLGRHASPNIAGVADLAGLWRAAEKAVAARQPAATDLLSLPASAAAMEELKAAVAAGRYYSQSSSREQETTAASMIVTQGVLSVASQMLEYALAANVTGAGLISAR